MTNNNIEDFDADLETQEQEEQFIRGTITCQVWGIVLREDPAEIAMFLNNDDGELGEEYDKLLKGKDNKFDRAMADHYGIPYQYAGDDKIKLGRPYGPRYQKAWKDLGVTPSDSERAAAGSAVAFMKNLYQNHKPK